MTRASHKKGSQQHKDTTGNTACSKKIRGKTIFSSAKSSAPSRNCSLVFFAVLPNGTQQQPEKRKNTAATSQMTTSVASRATRRKRGRARQRNKNKSNKNNTYKQLLPHSILPPNFRLFSSALFRDSSAFLPGF